MPIAPSPSAPLSDAPPAFEPAPNRPGFTTNLSLASLAAPTDESHRRHHRMADEVSSVEAAAREALTRATIERMPIREVWYAYRRTNDARYRDRLVEHYMKTHVRRIAARMSATLPSQVDVDDLTQQGYLGLAESIERYDMERIDQVKFETFSSHRIYGAMQDYLRAIDTVPRLTRARAKKMQGLIDQFVTEHGRPPSVDEIRARVDVPEAQFKRMLDDHHPAVMVPFSSAAAESDEPDGESDAMNGFEDLVSGTPLELLEKEDLQHWITRGLARRDRLIVVLYYYEQMTMKEVGRTVGCSESRVSQRIESIRDCLRSRFVGVGAEEEFV
ncbi:MAG: sigma-70 family RNA polymerase sigma factor [Planctomycetota bacterium]